MKLIYADDLIEKLKESEIPKEYISECITAVIKCPSVHYDYYRVMDRLKRIFQHHSATKTVKRLVLEAVEDGIISDSE